MKRTRGVVGGNIPSPLENRGRVYPRGNLETDDSRADETLTESSTFLAFVARTGS